MLLSYNVTANVSVASTTLTGAYGMYFYSVTASHSTSGSGIYFGGTGYTTVSGTFAGHLGQRHRRRDHRGHE